MYCKYSLKSEQHTIVIEPRAEDDAPARYGLLLLYCSIDSASPQLNVR